MCNNHRGREWAVKETWSGIPGLPLIDYVTFSSVLNLFEPELVCQKRRIIFTSCYGLWGTISHQSEWLRSKSLQVINAGEGVEKREPSYTVGGTAPRFIPGVGKILWRRDRLPTPVFLPGEFHGQRNLAGYSPWGCKKLDTTEWLSLSLSFTMSTGVVSWTKDGRRVGVGFGSHI